MESLVDAEQAIEESFGSTIKLTIGETFFEADEDKAKAIENVLKYSKYVANKEYFRNKEVNYSNQTYNNLEKYITLGGTASSYYAKKAENDYMLKNTERYNVLTQITDYDNFMEIDSKLKEIRNNTKEDKAETIKYINSLNLTPIQKAIYLKMYYPSIRDYDQKIYDYIMNQDISQAEKESILKKLSIIK